MTSPCSRHFASESVDPAAHVDEHFEAGDVMPEALPSKVRASRRTKNTVKKITTTKERRLCLALSLFGIGTCFQGYN